MLDQHDLGFSKAPHQVEFFYKIPINKGNFNAGKDFYKGQVILVEDICDEDVEVEVINDNGNFDEYPTINIE